MTYTLPKLALDWTTGVDQLGIDVVRSGVATFVGSDGLIQSAPENTQRVDWSTGIAGLLVEESRTNTFQYSEDFSNAWWLKLGMLAFGSGSVANAVVSPDGTQNADLLIEDTSTGAHQVNTNLAFNFILGVTYCQSYFVRPQEINGRTKFTITFRSNWFGVNSASFDLVAKTATVTSGTGACGIEQYKDGWFRVWASATATATGTSPTDTFFSFANDAGATNYTGDGVSGAYIWGAQLEVGLFPTSYIPNLATGTTTRNADVATITGANFSDWWDASKGGVLVRARPATVIGVRPWVQFDDGTANEIIALRVNATNPELYIVDGGTPQAQIDAGTIAANTDYSLTGWWATNDCKARLNSGAVVTDTSATIPTVTQARLGSDGANYLNGHLASISYYDSFSAQIYTRRKNKAVFNLM